MSRRPLGLSTARDEETPGFAWLKAGDRTAPLFAFPGAGGILAEITPLAQSLGDTRAVACLDLAALDDWTSIEEMVDQALALIAEIQPSGPVHLLGYSFGGLLALETARRLREDGRRVAALMLVEGVYDRGFWPASVWATSQARRIGLQLKALRGGSLGEIAGQLKLLARNFTGRLVTRLGLRAGAPAKTSATPLDMKAACVAAMARFRPRPYAGPAIFFRALHDVFNADPERLWRPLVSELRIEALPFDHLEIMRRPDAAARLAGLVDARLAQAKAAAPLALVVAGRRWHASARLALELAHAGFTVRALCPPGHILAQMEFIQAARRLWPLAEIAAIAREIAAVQPDLLVPADDAAARMLHALYSQADEPVRRVIARSLGQGDYRRLYARADVARVAKAAGVAGPRTLVVETPERLAAALAELGLPAVVKTDGSTGGSGVAVVRDAGEADAAWRRLTRPPRALWSAKRLLLDREVDRLAVWLAGRRPTANLQPFVAGRPANAAAAVWRGEVLACVCSEVIETAYPSGPATVVKIVRAPQMEAAAARLARALNLSGLCGFDFILDEDGEAQLIEVNPRATPTAHLTDADGRSPIQALFAAVTGSQVAQGLARDGECVALFPQELKRDAASPHLASARHDVPTGSPALVRLGRGEAGRGSARAPIRPRARPASGR